MAHHKSAIKRLRQAEKRRLRNKAYKSKMKTFIKKVRSAQTKEEALELLKQAYSVIDKLAEKGIIKKNTAANKKRKIARFVNSLT
ncbi:MAG: 30S ribosomal protein S20 [Calditrichaeota bacterium]|nr:30S ribosomal protein S20 [Calditrichota bacterium]